MKENAADCAVVGAGIIGLAIAYFLAKSGKKVVVFERNSEAIGASVRNFGLIWPIGQAPEVYGRAQRSRQIWDDIVREAHLWSNSSGSLHLVYHPDELAVIEEFQEVGKQRFGYDCSVITAEEAMKKSPAIRSSGLIGALWSKSEMTVDPREALSKIPTMLREKYGVEFHYNAAVTSIQLPAITAKGQLWKAEQVFVCSGTDFETLYPEQFSNSKITKCKLQMMRTIAQPGDYQIGPALCAGLTLTFYSAFKICQTLPSLIKRLDAENKNFYKFGIHVLLSQHGTGELTIGDSHEYGLSPSPFDREEINDTILEYLQTFAIIPDLKIATRWQGVYPKIEGKTELILQPESGVTIVNGLGVRV